MEEQLDGIFWTLLQETGGMQAIKDAIQTKDLAGIVRAASKALCKARSFPMLVSEKKGADMSNHFRNEGNQHYKKGNCTEAISNYNKALAYAPNSSNEMKLAYSNISAVMLTIQAFKDCLTNITAALQLGCPENLRKKLLKRKEMAEKLVMIEAMRDVVMVSDDDMKNFTKFAVKKNSDVPCMSTDLTVDGNTVVAAKEIKSGTVVAKERAFVSASEEYNEYTSCYFCHKMCLFFVPCEGCCKALFCSKECREECLKEYHRIECDIEAYMGTMYRRDVNKMAVRAVIKMSLKLGWEKLGAAALDMGSQRLEKSSVSEAFDRDNPTSLLCYNDDATVTEHEMLNASLICASAIHCLERVQGYLPTDKKNRELATDALSRIMLHLNTTFMRKIMITSSSYDYETANYRCGAQRNSGWFSFASKLAHACSPNMLVLGLNNRIALVALRRIKKGDPITISYVDTFYENDIPPNARGQHFLQKRVFKEIQYNCECRACTSDWHSKSHVPGTLNIRQKLAYKLFKDAMKKTNFKDQMKGICTALDELGDLVNTTQHYEAFGHLRRTLNISQCAEDSNKTFGAISRYIYMVRKE